MTTRMNPPVFIGASAIIVALVLVGILMPEGSNRVFTAIQSGIFHGFGWFYILAVAGFLFTVVYVGASRYGTFKLGPDDSEPEFSYLSWIAMLFAAGMGIGIMFFAVAEPVLHYSSPPVGEGGTVEAAREAMVITFFHWGVHAWGIYGIVGLSLAYFGFRYNLPLTISSGLYPLLKERIHGPVGNAVDIFAVCGTLFGIATSLGFGVLQINAGLSYLTGIPNTASVQVLLIVVVTAAATVSVLTGLDAGIRRLSELNLVTAVVLMLFVLAVGPTAFLLQAFAQNIGAYLDAFMRVSFNLYAYRPTDWIGGWTLFYWAWWISWSPFVGMFIARISYGRTVREFVVGVLLVPAAFTFLWMTVFGNSAISLDMGSAAGAISSAVAEDVPVALFRFLDLLPFSAVTSTLAIILVAVFFVTSSDSGSLVIDKIAAGGAEDTPVWQRVYWCSLEGVTAALLLLSGGLGALQTMTLISALPFTFIMIALTVGLLRGMAADAARSGGGARPLVAHPVAQIPWTRRLERILEEPARSDVDTFIRSVVEPNLTKVAAALRERGIAAGTEPHDDGGFALVVPSETVRSFIYAVVPASRPLPAFSAADTGRGRSTSSSMWLAQTRFNDGSRGYDVMGFTGDELVADVLGQFEVYQHLVTSEGTALFAISPDPARV
ncbi:BCCT family transporter [Chthonobacter rhizosphaerae]|uniref:BCCT family transporter n=1 Tax=Chthonobacter rhizosphaerae TaxID=2735553 RepID=UPI0015EE85BA|nr:BCCT family transporter [Chthonobacter rhizosphaerae]